MWTAGTADRLTAPSNGPQCLARCACAAPSCPPEQSARMTSPSANKRLTSSIIVPRAIRQSTQVVVGCFATNAVLRHVQERVRGLSSRRAWSCVSPLAALSIHATTRRCPSDRFGKPDGTGLPSDAQAHSAAMVGAILPFVALIGEVTTLRDGCVHS